jgi:large subunit ribosomal protein L17
MVRNLVTSLFEHGRVETTPEKAKEARPFAEKMITLAKGGTLAHRRRALAALHDNKVVMNLFSEIAPRYAQRAGGYCRILLLEKHRIGDAGDLCLFELVEEKVQKKSKKAKRTRATVKGGAAGKETAAATPVEPAGEKETPQAADTAPAEKGS